MALCWKSGILGENWLILLIFGGSFYFLRSVVQRDILGNGGLAIGLAARFFVLYLRDNNLIYKGVMYEYENSNTNSLDWYNCALLYSRVLYVQFFSYVPNLTCAAKNLFGFQLNAL
jgi:hypothetical protein